MPRWFISHQGFKETAFDETEFRAIVSRGLLPPTAAVRREDSPTWRELGTVLAEHAHSGPMRPAILSGPIPVTEDPVAAKRAPRDRNVPTYGGTDSQSPPRRDAGPALMLSGAIILAAGGAGGWFAHAYWNKMLPNRDGNTVTLADRAAARSAPTLDYKCTWCGSGMESGNQRVVSCNGMNLIAKNICCESCLAAWTRERCRGRGIELRAG